MTPLRLHLAALLAAVTLLFGAAAPAAGQQVLRAAAVVNDEVISVLDLRMRMRLVMMSSGLEPDQIERARLRGQVLRTLINERLQLQAADRHGYQVSEEEVDQAVAQVAQRNDMTADQFLTILRRNDIMPDTFRNQIRANLAWQKVVRQRLGRDVTLSEEDVDEAVERIRSRQGDRQYRVREIFLPVDDDSNAAEIRRTAQRLVEQLRRGANFPALARQFSQAPTAADGGSIGWVLPENLPEPVAEAVQRMQSGQIAGPVRSFNGFHLVQLRDTRVIAGQEATVHLRELFMPLAEDAGAEASARVRSRLQELAADAEGCATFDALDDGAEAVRTSDLGEVKMGQLPDGIRERVAELPVDRPSEPMPVSGGLAVLMVCERDTGIDRDQVRRNLLQDRLGMLAQRYMRDLRRQANIDVRLDAQVGLDTRG
jgi:peptidyl-prolyl cis-trans isomerase SurA